MFDDENGGLLGQVKTLATIGKYSRYLEDSQDTLKNWGKFSIIFLIGGIIIMMSLPLSSFLLINPKPFCTLFSVGSLIILFALLQVIEINQLIKKFGSVLQIFIYTASLLLSLYAGIFNIGYFLTIFVLFVQLGSLAFILISQFPGGKTGLMFVMSQVAKKIVDTGKSLFGLGAKKSFLPL